MKNTQTQTAERKPNTELANVSEWLKVNKLSLNVHKSKYMIFHTNRKQVNPLHLLIDNITIERALQNMPLQPNSGIHNYETRTRHHIYQPKTKHEYAKQIPYSKDYQLLA